MAVLLRSLVLLAVLAALVAAEPLRAELPLAALDGDPVLLAPLRSSALLAPKTAAAFTAWTAAPAGRGAARVSLVEEALAGSHDHASLLASLERHRAPMRELCRTTATLVVVVSGIPRWLARPSQGDQPPCDVVGWARAAEALARWLAGFPGPRRFYEIWNEPDLGGWPGTPGGFASFHALTARSLRAGDPAALVGGPALNAWGGRLPGDEVDLVRRLLRAAARDGRPLDFVSWHCFSPDPGDIVAAAEDCRRAAAETGTAPAPQMVLSEWNAPDGTRAWAGTAAHHAECLDQILAAGIGIQTVAAWEDFSPGDGPLGGYGLLTQGGMRKPVWHLHRLIDALARQGGGWARRRVGALRLLAAGTAADLRLIAWVPLPEPRAAALSALQRAVPLATLSAEYGQAETVLAWIGRGRSRDGLRDSAFAAARSAMEAAAAAAAASALRIELRLPGLPASVRPAALALGGGPRAVVLERDGDLLACDLAPGEVLAVAWPYAP